MSFLCIRATATDPDGNNAHSPVAHTLLLALRHVTRSPSISTTFLRGLSCFGELAKLPAARNASLSTLRPSCSAILPLPEELPVSILKGDPPAFNGLANFIARLDTYCLVLTLYDRDFHPARNDTLSLAHNVEDDHAVKRSVTELITPTGYVLVGVGYVGF
jgi:hypothetical protein